jgi:protein tyrosine/serine phosphatase
MKKVIIHFVIVAVATAAVYFSWIGIQQFIFGNVHAVIPGELYRSAQLTEQQIADMSSQYGIKTIINLRGDNAGTPWYDEEILASDQLGIKHMDFRMKSTRVLDYDRARELVQMMRDAPKPLLVHCAAGADRTGLASALYLAEIAKMDEVTAESQLSLRYGHMPFWWSESHAMDRTFEYLEPAMGFCGS